MLQAEPPGRLLGQRIAVALAVRRAHEGGDDLEVPLADLACLAPQVGEPQVDVELEQIDARRAGRHGTRVKTAPDGPGGWLDARDKSVTASCCAGHDPGQARVVSESDDEASRIGRHETRVMHFWWSAGAAEEVEHPLVSEEARGWSKAGRGAIAAPPVLARMRADSGTHRVEDHVTRELEHVCVTFGEHGLVSPLEDVAFDAVALVEPLRVPAQLAMHPRRQIGLGRLKE